LTTAVVDTNVLVTANSEASQASANCIKNCVQYLDEIARNGQLVLDDGWRILREYMRQARSTGQPGPGDAFLKWVLTNQANEHRCPRVRISTRGDAEDEFVEFPHDPALAGFDRADRKFAAVARASPLQPPVANATDTDWWAFREPLARYGVSVEFLCPELMGSRRVGTRRVRR